MQVIHFNIFIFYYICEKEKSLKMNVVFQNLSELYELIIRFTFNLLVTNQLIALTARNVIGDAGFYPLIQKEDKTLLKAIAFTR